MRHQLPQQLDPLAPLLKSNIDSHPRDIAAWACQARDDASFDRTTKEADDWNCGRGRFEVEGNFMVVARIKSGLRRTTSRAKSELRLARPSPEYRSIKRLSPSTNPNRLSSPKSAFTTWLLPVFVQNVVGKAGSTMAMR